MRAQCEICDCKIGEGWCQTCSGWLSRANTDAERQRRRYARRKAGLVRVEVWVPAEAEDAVRMAVDKAVSDAADDAAAVRTVPRGDRRDGMSDRDMIRMALHDAIGWQLGLAAAYSHIPDSQERADALATAKKYRSILRRRYAVQETREERLDRVPTVSIDEIRAARPTTPGTGDGE